MNETDFAIVHALLGDGRATLAKLAEATGLSVSAVQARVRRLEERGVISGYRAQVDPEAVGLPLSAFIEVSPLDAGDPDDIPEKLVRLNEVEACHSVAGDAAYMLFVRVSGPKRLEDLIREIRQVAHVSTRTTVVLQTYFADRPPSVNVSGL
jgi:Lrp/AsnC family transcriptional regulator, leucine-responsive regulatory protein